MSDEQSARDNEIEEYEAPVVEDLDSDTPSVTAAGTDSIRTPGTTSS